MIYESSRIELTKKLRAKSHIRKSRDENAICKKRKKNYEKSYNELKYN